MSTEKLLEKYTTAVKDYRRGGESNPTLLIAESGALQTYYAPFEYINPRAKVVFVGITPGRQQAANALERAHAGLIAGEPEAVIQRSAKEFASFSGGMRKNLVDCLDAIGVNDWLGIDSAGELFAKQSDLAHFTSVLRYPTFVGGDNYSGKPEILKTPFLLDMVNRWFATELPTLSEAIWIPLGPTPTSVLEFLAERGLVDSNHILAGLPHPSGANAERISYFLGLKSKEKVSAKTNAAQLDMRRDRLSAQVAGLRRLSMDPIVLPAPGMPEPGFVEGPSISKGSASITCSISLPASPAAAAVEVPVAKDGSWFGPHIKRTSGYTIGEKGDEVRVSDIDDAIRQLRRMSVPRWRRPNAEGIWGIVSGVRWARLSELDKDD